MNAEIKLTLTREESTEYMYEHLKHKCRWHGAYPGTVACPSGIFDCPFAGKSCPEISPDDWRRVLQNAQETESEE